MGTEHGDIWWSEIYAHDIAKTAAFYKAVAGWEVFAASMTDMSRPAKPGEDSYTLFKKNGQPVCGGMSLAQLGMQEVPPHWFTFIAVADVDVACKATVAAGGKVHRQPWDIPGVGRIAIIVDNGGAAVGLGTPVKT